MPIYEYRCAACGHHLEVLQKMTDAALRKCPDCGKAQLKRLVSASRFRLKGSGWYETDFKNQNETKRNLVEKAGAESRDGAATSEPATDATAKTEATKAVAAEKGDGAAKSVKPKETSAKSPAPKRSKSAAKTRTAHKAAKR
jgi:putative FmdB family regulatory protein